MSADPLEIQAKILRAAEAKAANRSQPQGQNAAWAKFAGEQGGRRPNRASLSGPSPRRSSSGGRSAHGPGPQRGFSGGGGHSGGRPGGWGQQGSGGRPGGHPGPRPGPGHDGPAMGNQMPAMPMLLDNEGVDKISDPWTWWYDDKSNAKKTSWDENQIQEIGMVGSLQAFWRLSESVLKPSALMPGSTYHFFRRGVKPTWEHEANINGGRWVFYVAKDAAYIDYAWTRIQMGLVGCLIDIADHINGIVCQRRRQGDRLSIWIRGDLTLDEILGVAKRTAEVLELKARKPDGRFTIEFKAHPVDASSKVKSCDKAVTTPLGTSAVEQSLDNPKIRSLPSDAFEKE